MGEVETWYKKKWSFKCHLYIVQENCVQISIFISESYPVPDFVYMLQLLKKYI